MHIHPFTLDQAVAERQGRVHRHVARSRRAGSAALAVAALAFGGLATAACQPTTVCQGAIATIVGTEKADTLRGTPNRDVILGLGGNDVIDGLAGNDVICGGAGNDRIAGGEGADGIDGDAGNDVVDGGTEGDAIVDSGPATDVNTAIGGAGDDLLKGGLGTDTASYADSPTPITYDANKGQAFGRGTDTFTVSIERVVGSPQADVLMGGARNDSLDGAAGDDFLTGAAGDDRLTGGAGTDRVSFSSAPRYVVVSLFTGKALGDGTDTLVGVENVDGTIHNDVLTGDPGPNVIDGGRGQNSCNGGGGTDTLIRCS